MQRLESGNLQMASEYYYNAETRKWEKRSVTTSSSTESSKGNIQQAKNSKSTSSSSSKKSASSSSSSKETSQTNTQDVADKEYREIEYNTLEGDLTITLSNLTHLIHVGDTVQLDGLGTNLSGLYFVSKIKRTLSGSSGYSVVLTVIKTGFNDGIKGGVTDGSSSSRPNEVTKK